MIESIKTLSSPTLMLATIGQGLDENDLSTSARFPVPVRADSLGNLIIRDAYDFATFYSFDTENGATAPSLSFGGSGYYYRIQKIIISNDIATSGNVTTPSYLKLLITSSSSVVWSMAINMTNPLIELNLDYDCSQRTNYTLSVTAPGTGNYSTLAARLSYYPS